MGDYQECVCGGMIRMRSWHGRLQWVHIETGRPHCLGPLARPRPEHD